MTTPRFDIYQLPLPTPSDPRYDTQAEAVEAMYEQMRRLRRSSRRGGKLVAG